jgi:hypothetical protein
MVKSLFRSLKKIWNAPHQIERVLRKMSIITDEIVFLQEQVTTIGTVVDSAIALINGFAAQIEVAKGDEAKLTELALAMKDKSAALAAAVAANTVVEPTPVVTPEPAPVVEPPPPVVTEDTPAG